MYDQFLPRNAMHSADHAVTTSQDVCPSVRHTPVLCSESILVLPHETARQYSDGDPQSRRRRMKKIAIFDKYLALSQKL